MKNFFIVLLSFFIAQTVLAEQGVVVDSSVKSMAKGTVVDSALLIELKKGENLKIMLEDGRILELTGPYKGQAVTKAGGKPTHPQLIQAMKRLFSADVVNTSSVGAVRSSAENLPPSPWILSIDQPGPFCFSETARIKIWRSEVTAVPSAHLRSSASQAYTIFWKEGEREASWPDGLKMGNNDILLIRPEGALSPVKLTLHQIPREKSQLLDRVYWMIDKGCLWQARALVLNASPSK